MDVETVRRGFLQLRGMCDPRGHALLDAIEETLVDSLEAVEKLDAMFQIERTLEAVDWQDNTRWSRKAPELRSVS